MTKPKLIVRAAAGLRVPMERSRRQIGAAATLVPDTQYYRRRLASGELVAVDPSLQEG